MNESWFSASLRFTTQVADDEADQEDSVILLRAPDWEVAFARAVALGRQMEQTYKNGVGATVEKRLVEVRTLDELGEAIPDGREVYCAPVEANQAPVSSRPEDSRPTQTGV